MENRFNLVDEPWIPLASHGNVSLKDVFTRTDLPNLSGTPIQKLAILKLLLAIVQRAYTPEDELAWRDLDIKGMCERAMTYLNEKKDCFFLYGDKPFLQMPILGRFKYDDGSEPLVQSIGTNYLPDIQPANSNNSILFETQREHVLSDAEKAVFIVTQMNYSLGGKRIIKEVQGLYPQKVKSAKSGPSLGGSNGYLSSFLLGTSLEATVYFNIILGKELKEFPKYRGGKMIPPWENMPATSFDQAANELKEGFMGTLCGLSRFVLLKDDGIIFAEGIQYPTLAEGWSEFFLAINQDKKALYVNMDKRPWRNLTSLLSFSFAGAAQNDFNCKQISFPLSRVRQKSPVLGIWSGGLKVRQNAGDQSVKQSDDFLESEVFFDSAILGESWFNSFKNEINEMDSISRTLWSSVSNYYKDQKDNESQSNGKAVEMFWHLAEGLLPDLISSCENPELICTVREKISEAAYKSFDCYCPKTTGKQMLLWVKNRPVFSKYNAKNKEG